MGEIMWVEILADNCQKNRRRLDLSNEGILAYNNKARVAQRYLYPSSLTGKWPMFEKDPRTFSPEYRNLSPEQKAMVKLEITLTRFFKEFNQSVLRWERMIYPAMVIFAILGLSGFYLIYHVTKDMRVMSGAIDPQMETNMSRMAVNIEALAQHIQIMTTQVTALAENIQSMGDNIAHMDGNIASIDGNIAHMNDNIAQMNEGIGQIDISFKHMNYSMDRVTTAVTGIQTNVVSMDRAIGAMSGSIVQMNQSMKAITFNTGHISRDLGQMSRPMDKINSFIPW